ncbi:DUF2528 family protein [Acinetobacter courvalinii]|uniref:DUF2528 family protein n=1 Tax=Acinetobacter courvalinii TaxID=280147 RepID=N9R0E7_9GAMM|nr:DUF2528 family protein [Acinetobacter courvalinii]ENX35811.1 hypothetical protein F888_03644 [Acinetobacter courvalinii]KAB0655963.1 DUF2528 family protein [Acinetobacter courvalinii]GGH39057.1 hypothetical protein GCM10007354_24560 [Acinetobacter courvalinii]
MQNDSTLQTEQAEIPEYLQCDPRTFHVKYDKWSDVCDLEFTIVIKCTDSELHEHNNFWSNHESRLKENNGDIVKVILKMISKKVFWACYNGKDTVATDIASSWGINSIFHEEGWGRDCFEITKIHFDNYVSGDDFEFTPVNAEG